MSSAKIALLTACVIAIVAAGPAAGQNDTAATQAVEAVAYDYVDGQLEGNVDRVQRALHPDLAKRTPRKATPYETLALGRMTADELISLTRKGALKTPREQWQRSVTVLGVDQDIATVRVETPWFIDHLQLARLNDRWVIVNALWRGKPRPAQP
ncbi:nuclear transport factor 2 family protein [Caulobacter mirabilis]|uniref:Nuclear transport factor 2 family protein n=1 Tax=Caulobacter mirabilis TaxID=69666 RepID=A0A2D2AZC6_9CAUL|nr:nuclear transport factor 2 family protein [Caulobacter mirabilis]ATQ43342.1 hypothetical protein CSW64_13410 [Caulobacter mirabilis]